MGRNSPIVAYQLVGLGGVGTAGAVVPQLPDSPKKYLKTFVFSRDWRICGEGGHCAGTATGERLKYPSHPSCLGGCHDLRNATAVSVTKAVTKTRRIEQ